MVQKKQTKIKKTAKTVSKAKPKSKATNEPLPRQVGKPANQSGSIKDMIRDLERAAMKPGKRISINNTVYWETRKNRSDRNPEKRL